MIMKKRKMQMLMVSAIFHALLLTTMYMFQGAIFPYLRLNGLVPLLLPIVSTGVAVNQGRVAGGISGLVAGILCDISFNEPVGLFMMILTLAGLVVGFLADTVLTRGFVSYLCCCAAVLSFAAIVQLFPLLLFVRVAPAPLFSTALWQTVYSLAFAFPIWFFVRSPNLMMADV